MIILGHHSVAILLAKILIWAPFLQLMSTFPFCINLSHDFKIIVGNLINFDQVKSSISAIIITC